MYSITFGDSDPIECSYLLTAIYILLANYMQGPEEPMKMEYIPDSEFSEPVENSDIPNLTLFDK